MRQNLDYDAIAYYGQNEVNTMDFTRKSEEKFYSVVDLADFQDYDAEKIFDCLKNELRLIPFCDYLKRYIFIKSGMTGDFRSVDLKEYQHIIINSFKENNTPKSFSETTAKLSALSKNWLTQASVNRQIIFLLGFGLDMSLDDVSTFLVKAQKERDFNFKEPNEIIFWYCFKNRYKFLKARQLQIRYNEMAKTSDGAIYGDMTKRVRDTFQGIKDDISLLNYLTHFKSNNKKSVTSITAFKWFSDLYQASRTIISDYYNNDEEEKLWSEIDKYRTLTKNSEKLTEKDKNEHIQQMRAARKVWSAHDITESDVERIICCGTPIDKSGNLRKISASKLARHFSNKRLSRQHLRELLLNEVAVDRYDLITLNFFIFSQNEE